MYLIIIPFALESWVVTVTVRLYDKKFFLSSTSCNVAMSSLTLYSVASHRMLTPGEKEHTHSERWTLKTLHLDTHGLHPQSVWWLSPDPVPLLCCHWAGSAAQ